MDRIRFGRAVRALRSRHAWTQGELSVRARLSRTKVSRVERGQIGRIVFDDIDAIARALDGQLGLDFRWRGEALDRLIDERHAALVEAIVQIFLRAGWEVDVEVSFSIYGERGSIDVFARHPPTGLIAVVEVKGSIGEAGNTLIGVDRKVRLAPVIARERGWRCTGVAKLLVVAEGNTARDRINRHRNAFRSALPATTRECLAWIRSPTSTVPAGILFIAPRNVRGVRKAGR